MRKTLLAFELLVCFGPMTLMLMMGAVLIPIQVIALFLEPLLWEGPVQVIGSVLCGVVGLGTLSLDVEIREFEDRPRDADPGP